MFLFNINNKYISKTEKIAISIKFNKFKQISSLSKINNRCIISGRNKNTNSKYNLSRFMLRNQMKRNLISLIRKD
jgi:ribosomal protein S14